jgi:hypothetical protein
MEMGCEDGRRIELARDGVYGITGAEPCMLCYQC